MNHKRDMVGYGKDGPKISWPNDAHCVINFVINYEEGAELSPINGDLTAETYGGEFPLVSKPKGQRHLSMESLFDYGARCGIWRLIRLFDEQSIPVTFFITGYALALNSEFASYLQSSKHDIAGHGWRWIDYAKLSKQQEKEDILKCLQGIRTLTGKDATGWYTGRQSAYTRELITEHSNLIYCSDSYADDWPYWKDGLLMLPYSLVNNDFRYTTIPGWGAGQLFLQHLIDTFDCLYQENRGAVMTIGLHARYSGHPGRCWAIHKFINYIKAFSDIWIAHRVDIAKYWQEFHLK